jgi:hypothetical protein
MFILKRQDVEISSFHHPSKDQKIPILAYQGQTFRLLNVFSASQEEEARALWRELTDHRGKACVLLEEPDRFSVWGKIRLEGGDAVSATSPDAVTSNVSVASIRACILILQAIHEDVSDLLGAKQAKRFEEDFGAIGSKHHLPQASSPQAVSALLLMDPFAGQLPAWQEQHLNLVLQELHRLGKNYFGKANFTNRALESLTELPSVDRSAFLKWLSQSPNHSQWQA